MTYKEVILNLANSITEYFDEVYHSAELVSISQEKFPAIVKADEWINLSPTDQRETIYIRRNGDDEVQQELKVGSCGKSYQMRTPIRVVYFKDHSTGNLPKLMQSVLINGTKLIRISQDKWRLQKDESSGNYNFGANTAYFAIDIYINWHLVPETCDEDLCIEDNNPVRKN